MDNKAFDYRRIAQGYKERPFLHKKVIERFQKDITKQYFANGLDIGCGAGLSTKALKRICGHVTGADISEEMVKISREVCDCVEGYDFIISKAEEIPAGYCKYDIVTAAGVIQWVEREPFLQNLKNVMNKNGYFLIYDFCISDKMKDNEEYSQWWHDLYLKEFPKPYRNEYVWTDRDVEKYGFKMLDQVQYEMEHEFDMGSFIEFMLIQSNVNAKIEGEGRNVDKVRRWFEESLTPIFDKERKTLIFKAYSWYIKAV